MVEIDESGGNNDKEDILGEYIIPTFFLMTFVFLIGWGVRSCMDPEKTGPVRERTQTVFEARCEHGTQRFYSPVNSYGIVFDKDGNKVSKLPDCTVVHVGKSDSIGGGLK